MAPNTRNAKTTTKKTTEKGNLQKKKKKEPSTLVSDSSDNESDIEGNTNAISINLENLEHQFRDQRKAIGHLTKSFDYMADGFDEIKKQMTQLINEQKRMKKEIERLTENEKVMKNRIERLEMETAKEKQKSNDNHLIITNLPKIQTELKATIIEIGNQVGCQIDASQIIDVYQSENKKYKTHPLIVKLKTNEFKRKCSEFRKSGNYIDVTKLSKDATSNGKNINFHPLLEREFAELLKKAKISAKKKSYKFVWINGTTVMVKKTENTTIIKINSIDDLKKIV